MRLAVSHKNAFTQANIGKHSDALRSEHEEPVALLQVREHKLEPSKDGVNATRVHSS